MAESIQKAGNCLDELLGLNPGEAGAPEKIWKALKQRSSVTGAAVELTFYHWDHDQTEGQVTLSYDCGDSLDAVRKDCDALDHLRFDSLVRHAS
jgi:hypothetical protein